MLPGSALTEKLLTQSLFMDTWEAQAVFVLHIAKDYLCVMYLLFIFVLNPI